MSVVNELRNAVGVVTVQIEGFFTERFINLCRINNVKIWDIRNVVKGVMRFKINLYDFKKLRKIARKTKCKIIVKNKKGIYFTLFKYRKRKLVFLLVFLALVISILSSTFIWKIDIKGNSYIGNETLMEALKESGVYIGSCKIGMDKKEVVNNLRVMIPDLSWAGFELDGTKAVLEVVEKTKLEEKDKQNTELGNIISTKSGVITKIVPENGTAVFKPGSFVENGTIVIEGAVYSKYIDPIQVPAKGIVKINCEYNMQKEYRFDEVLKNKNGVKKYTIGISVNSKENMLNYLNKDKKYDITKSSKQISLFGNTFSFDLYKCEEYEEVINTRDKDTLIKIAENDSNNYLETEILANTKEGTLVDKTYEVQDIDGGIIVTTKFIVNEEVGRFVAGEVQIRTNENQEGNN